MRRRREDGAMHSAEPKSLFLRDRYSMRASRTTSGAAASASMMLGERLLEIWRGGVGGDLAAKDVC